jgi:hypothetical protein
LEGRPILGEAFFQEAFGFGNQAAAEHFINAQIDSVTEVNWGASQAKQRDRVARPCRAFQPVAHGFSPFGPLRRKGFAGQSNHLQGSDDTTKIVAVNPLVCFPVSLLQFKQQLG